MNVLKKISNVGIAISLIAVCAIVMCGYLYYKNAKLIEENKELSSRKVLSAQQVKTVEFGHQFVNDVLKTDQEIGFETRLLLENSVREVGDADIEAQWKKFTDSDTEEDAQNEVENLLGLFFEKLK